MEEPRDIAAVPKRKKVSPFVYFGAHRLFVDAFFADVLNGKEFVLNEEEFVIFNKSFTQLLWRSPKVR